MNTKSRIAREGPAPLGAGPGTRRGLVWGTREGLRINSAAPCGPRPRQPPHTAKASAAAGPLAIGLHANGNYN